MIETLLKVDPALESKVDTVQRQSSGRQVIPEIITVTSGKGGVGKTNMSVNLGLILTQRKQRVLMMDADLYLGKLDIILGASPQYTLADLIDGTKTIEEVIMHHPSGLDVLPATSGDLNFMEADQRILKTLAEAFAAVQDQYDYIIVDTAAGISNTVLSMAFGADKVILVITPEPASISDVYAMVKVISNKMPDLPLILVPNRVKSQDDGLELHKKLNLITQKFLHTNLHYGGSVVEDSAVRQSVVRQRPFVLEFPKSQATHNLQIVCHRMLKLQPTQITHRSNLFDRFREKRKVVESL